eukprot:CAMPEP_0116979218 /NCGR_PEP_ID=MMETSP0467-20121206/58301_1 /TAXON_ID=283647 /ORGANISM="Mesodinium pulex, Strain SPMC105" /LENGTH=79 /DNA_ID=CAMNT_0004672847 /DNA_START=702 /DNA_END=941 /DNA_ORIENTATION=+
MDPKQIEVCKKEKEKNADNGNYSKLDMDSFTFRNSDKKKISLGVTEGRNIDEEKLGEDEMKIRRAQLNGKFKKLKKEET